MIDFIWLLIIGIAIAGWYLINKYLIPRYIVPRLKETTSVNPNYVHAVMILNATYMISSIILIPYGEVWMQVIFGIVFLLGMESIQIIGASLFELNEDGTIQISNVHRKLSQSLIRLQSHAFLIGLTSFIYFAV